MYCDRRRISSLFYVASKYEYDPIRTIELDFPLFHDLSPLSKIQCLLTQKPNLSWQYVPFKQNLNPWLIV